MSTFTIICRTVFIIALTVALGYFCTGCTVNAGNTEAPSDDVTACVSATPEAGGDVSLCPSNTLIISTCSVPTRNPVQSTDCSGVAAFNGMVWCCVAGVR